MSAEGLRAGMFTRSSTEYRDPLEFLGTATDLRVVENKITENNEVVSFHSVVGERLE